MKRCLILVSLLALWTGAAPGADPFLERFRVGAYREAAVLATDGSGWPRDLFPAPTFDETSTRSERALVETAAADGPGTALVLAAFPDSLDAFRFRSAWAAGRQDRRGRIAAALAHWQAGEHRRVAAISRSLAADSGTAEERLVWTLRALAAEERVGIVAEYESEFWLALLELGPFDAPSGWNIWAARRRAVGDPELPAWIDERRSALWLSRLGGRGPGPSALQGTGFASDVEAALRAAILPRGEELARHLERHPGPPGDRGFAGLWARGHQRRGSYAPVSEALAARGDLPGALRVGLLRKAADRRLTDGDWRQALEDLERAVALAGDLPEGATLRRLRNECRRAEALARHRDRSEFAGMSVALQGRLGPEPLGDDAPLTAARTLVRSGEAGEVGTPDAAFTPAARAARLDSAWAVWARWGKALTEEPVYLRELAAVTTAPNSAARLKAVTDAVARRLGRSPVAVPALGWALELDFERRSGERSLAAASPISDLLDGRSRAEIHALLGLCLLAGDPRGQLACAYRLPQRGLSRAERRVFLYPLPSRGGIADLLEADPDPSLALAVARNESLFDPGVRSRSGALGWMQIMPFHFPGDGYADGTAIWRVPAVSVAKGLELLRRYAARYDDDPYRTLAAYNAGPGAVDRWDRQLGGTPDRATFLAWIGYPETREYVEKVLIDREIYANILGRSFREVETSP